MRYTAQSLTQLSLTLLRAFGCNDEEANIVANHLVKANLSGHDSHGIGTVSYTHLTLPTICSV